MALFTRSVIIAAASGISVSACSSPADTNAPREVNLPKPMAIHLGPISVRPGATDHLVVGRFTYDAAQIADDPRSIKVGLGYGGACLLRELGRKLCYTSSDCGPKPLNGWTYCLDDSGTVNGHYATCWAHGATDCYIQRPKNDQGQPQNGLVEGKPYWITAVVPKATDGPTRVRLASCLAPLRGDWPIVDGKPKHPCIADPDANDVPGPITAIP